MTKLLKKFSFREQKNYMVYKTDFQMMYHNVQTLLRHFNDVVKDKLILNSDFICLVETWSL